MKRCIVTDTGILAAAFFPETHTMKAQPILHAIRRNEVDAVAPTVFLTEFANVCRKKILAGGRPTDVDDIFGEVLELPILWWESIESMARRAWRLHRSSAKMGTNDAHFFLLAQDWNAELWTLDGPLHEAGERVEKGRVRYLARTAFAA
jgi:predicted nucleic acid-binding protein